MKYNINAKTTCYGGVNFRSILEARWAAFFDLIDLEWKYEPHEINGKIPDFVLYVNNKTQYATNQIIVEIKPTIFIDEKFKRELLVKYHDVKAHILILHESPFYKSQDYNTISIGYLSQYLGHDEHCEFYDGELKGLFDIGSSYMIFDGIFGECHVNDRKYFTNPNSEEHEILLNMWNHAQNEVQFKSY